MTTGGRIRSRARAFTLIEMFIAMSVIAIVAAVGIASVRSSMQAAQQQNVVQDAKDDMLTVRDSAVSTIQCRRVTQQIGGGSNRGLKIFHDVNCTPDVTGDDLLLNTIVYPSSAVLRVEVIDNGIFDDEMIQYRTDGSLFDTETTKVRVTTVDTVVHNLSIQLATGGVILE